MRHALDPDFNRCILSLAPAFVARDDAPGTFPDILRNPGIIYAGHSDRTIYADPHVNHAFRAWHDDCHIAGMHDFTLAGEAAAAELQIVQMLRRYPLAPLRWQKIIRAEVTGQADYFAKHGAFPEDQFAFMRDILED